MDHRILKITRKIVYFLFTGPLGADNATTIVFQNHAPHPGRKHILNFYDIKFTRLAGLFVRLASSGPSWTSKITRKNVYFLFTGPLGADNAAINPATTRIIPAIRRLYAQSGPKVTPKWSQSAPKVTLICQKLSQNDLKATPKQPNTFIKSLKCSGKMSVFENRPDYTQSNPTMIPK